MIRCGSCGQAQQRPFPFCPNCGRPLLSATARGDEVVFNAPGWTCSYLVKAEGRVLSQVSHAILTNKGLTVWEGADSSHNLAALDLYRQLLDPDRELLVI